MISSKARVSIAEAKKALWLAYGADQVPFAAYMLARAAQAISSAAAELQSKVEQFYPQKAFEAINGNTSGNNSENSAAVVPEADAAVVPDSAN